jgi:hypothetical protein
MLVPFLWGQLEHKEFKVFRDTGATLVLLVL